MTARVRGLLATLFATTSLAMVAAAVILLVPNMALPEFASFGSNGWGGLVFAATFSAAGWLIVSRRPDNRIGWVFLGAAFFQALEAIAGQYAAFGLLGHPGTVRFAGVASWVTAWAWTPGLLLLFVALLLFPDGHLPSRRWRPVLWLIGVILLVIVVPRAIAGWPYRGAALFTDSLPPGASDAIALPMAIAQIGNIALVPIAILAVAGVVVRFRRSVGVERQQLKWFTYAAAIQVAVLIPTGGDASLPPPYDLIVAVLTWPLIPIAVAIAVLRYRLYDIDLVIRRTLVYVPLTALLAGLYAASLGVSQRVFILVIGDRSDAAVIISTLILATTFTPIKNAIQGRVDRAFREAQDAERRLGAFVQAIEADWSTPEPGRAIRAFLGVAVAAVRASGGEAFLGSGDEACAIGASSSTVGPVAAVATVEAEGRVYGRIELGTRVGGRPYPERELEAVRAAARRLAAVLAGIDGAISTAPHPAIPQEAVTEALE